MTIEATNVAIMDGLTLFRKPLKNYLSEHTSINVVIQASDFHELMHKLRDFRVDILLLDIFITKINAKEILNNIRTTYPEIKMLVLSECLDMSMISEILDFGIYGYISKTDEPEELIKAIKMASNNRIYRNEIFTEALYWNKLSSATVENNDGPVTLNEREQTIIQLLWEERSNREIADQLFLSIRSIEKIRQDMKEKLGVKSTVGLFKYGIERNIIEVYKSRINAINK